MSTFASAWVSLPRETVERLLAEAPGTEEPAPKRKPDKARFRISDGFARGLRWAGSIQLSLMLLGILLFWHVLVDHDIILLIIVIPVSTTGVVSLICGMFAGYWNTVLDKLEEIHADYIRARVERTEIMERLGRIEEAGRTGTRQAKPASLPRHDSGPLRLLQQRQDVTDEKLDEVSRDLRTVAPGVVDLETIKNLKLIEQRLKENDSPVAGDR